jgi:hypothetical protein
MPVAARVVGDGDMTAVGALVAVSTERCGAAACDGQQHLLVLSVDPPTTTLDERVSGKAHNVGHLE